VSVVPVVLVAALDVTRRASQLLLAHRGLLTPPQLARLAAKMAEVGMSSELRELVAASGASGSHAGQAVGFVAAALTGEAGLQERHMQGLQVVDRLHALFASTTIVWLTSAQTAAASVCCPTCH
jgi:hypothetical protein